MTNYSICEHNFSDSMIKFSIYYIFSSCFLGILCNTATLWCLVGCPRTRPAIKVLLCAPFCTILLTCLLGIYLCTYILLWCEEPNSWVTLGILLVTDILAMAELFYILIIAFISGSHPRLLLLYDILDSLSSHVIRNKRRLAAIQDTTPTGKVMDQATRALLAVFINNLLFVQPHIITLFVEEFIYMNDSISLISSTLFMIHFFTDPLVFVGFNKHHRKRVLQALKLLQPPPLEHWGRWTRLRDQGEGEGYFSGSVVAFSQCGRGVVVSDVLRRARRRTIPVARFPTPAPIATPSQCRQRRERGRQQRVNKGKCEPLVFARLPLLCL
ncbi:hypothetical protein O3P69_000252 [Scylla paramamosain]|uniref:G-protein coupled receptors family 1 profile domain-containing protein n=1 Tax=Scylla paramamosain TaxID=85552 RepID=A0AAW0UWY9_SCYPA